MAVLSYNHILPKKVILWNGEPAVVLSAHVFRKQQRKPVNQSKLRGLRTGKVYEQTFHQNENAEEADVVTRTLTFLYENRGQYFFCEPDTPSKHFSLSAELVGTAGRYLKQNSEVAALAYNDDIIGVIVPIKVDLAVTEADPALRGNTAQGGSKEAVLETGAKILVPLFISPGDVVRVNTESGAYAERVAISK